MTTIKTTSERSLSSLVKIDPQLTQRKKQVQAAYWKGEAIDVLPILFYDPPTAEQQEMPEINFSEAFYDKELMLLSQLQTAAGAATSHSESVPSIRANLGTGTCLATIGLEQEVFADKMPWLQTHLSLDQALKLCAEDISIRGTFARGMEMIQYFKNIMGNSIDTYCMDTQGPFDLAHLLIGDDLFMDLYDRPEDVHALMELCLQIGIRTHTWMKDAIGEERNQQCHSNGLYAENMGIRICEDTTCLIGRDAIEEFALPYTRRLAAHFGGAWVHYCGRNDHLTELIVNAPEIRGINFGVIPGKEFQHDMEADMELIASCQKIYYGDWRRKPRESGKDFLKRLHYWSKKGALLPTNGNDALGKEQGFSNTAEALDYWRNL